jgi:hypothetical protein
MSSEGSSIFGGRPEAFLGELDPARRQKMQLLLSLVELCGGLGTVGGYSRKTPIEIIDFGAL